MKQFWVGLGGLLVSMAAMALAPYTSGTKMPAGDLAAQMSAVENKLKAEGFTVVGRYMSKGLAKVGTVIATEPAFLQVLGGLGGGGIAGAGIRVGVNADGSVSYMTPDYWYRAYVRSNYASADAAVKAVSAKLIRALGSGTSFGGDVPAEELANYRYMMGLERFDSHNSELHTHSSFEEAIKTIRDKLASHTAGTAKVYEVVLPERKLAVFGVAMEDAAKGDAWWVNKLGPTGPQHIAAMPYEVFVVGNKVYGLYGRYRIALAWPALTMGDFMNIRYAPDVILQHLSAVAGAPELLKSLN